MEGDIADSSTKISPQLGGALKMNREILHTISESAEEELEELICDGLPSLFDGRRRLVAVVYSVGSSLENVVTSMMLVAEGPGPITSALFLAAMPDLVTTLPDSLERDAINKLRQKICENEEHSSSSSHVHFISPLIQSSPI